MKTQPPAGNGVLYGKPSILMLRPVTSSPSVLCSRIMLTLVRFSLELSLFAGKHLRKPAVHAKVNGVFTHGVLVDCDALTSQSSCLAGCAPWASADIRSVSKHGPSIHTSAYSPRTNTTLCVHNPLPGHGIVIEPLSWVVG